MDRDDATVKLKPATYGARATNHAWVNRAPSGARSRSCLMDSPARSAIDLARCHHGYLTSAGDRPFHRRYRIASRTDAAACFADALCRGCRRQGCAGGAQPLLPDHLEYLLALEARGPCFRIRTADVARRRTAGRWPHYPRVGSAEGSRPDRAASIRST